jgi:hypothetical protein
MKDGRTHLAHKAEHAVDLDTGAVVALVLAPADEGDTTTIQKTVPEAGMNIAEAGGATAENATAKVTLTGPVNVVSDKGYHSNDSLKNDGANGEFAATYRNLIGDAAAGSTMLRRSTPCTPIEDGSKQSTAKSCCGGGASCWNVVSLMLTRAAACVASIGAVTTAS